MTNVARGALGMLTAATLASSGACAAPREQRPHVRGEIAFATDVNTEYGRRTLGEGVLVAINCQVPPSALNEHHRTYWGWLLEAVGDIPEGTTILGLDAEALRVDGEDRDELAGLPDCG